MSFYQKNRHLIRQTLSFTLVLILTFLMAESLARVVASLGKPVQGLHINYDHKFQIAQRKTENNKENILLLGNSLMNFSIYSELLEQRLLENGLTTNVINLGTPGSSPYTSWSLLKTAVAKNQKPKLVIFNITPDTFNQYSGQNKYTTVANSFNRSYIGACQFVKANSMTAKLDCFAQKNSFLYRHQGYFKELLLSLPAMIFQANKKIAGNPWGEDPHVYFETSPGGWSPAYPVYSNAAFQKSFALNETNLEKADKVDSAKFIWDQTIIQPLTAYCKENRIPLILLWLPVHASMDDYNHFYHFPAHTELSQKINTFAQENQLYFIDLYASDLSSSHYYDRGHQNVLGAITATENLAHHLLNKPNLKPLLIPFNKKTLSEG